MNGAGVTGQSLKIILEKMMLKQLITAFPLALSLGYHDAESPPRQGVDPSTADFPALVADTFSMPQKPAATSDSSQNQYTPFAARAGTAATSLSADESTAVASAQERAVSKGDTALAVGAGIAFFGSLISLFMADLYVLRQRPRDFERLLKDVEKLKSQNGGLIPAEERAALALRARKILSSIENFFLSMWAEFSPMVVTDGAEHLLYVYARTDALYAELSGQKRAGTL